MASVNLIMQNHSFFFKKAELIDPCFYDVALVHLKDRFSQRQTTMFTINTNGQTDHWSSRALILITTENFSQPSASTIWEKRALCTLNDSMD